MNLKMHADFNFRIAGDGIISSKFLKMNICDFDGAKKFVKQLPYKRNSDKNDLAIVLKELHGTCSTKHALLKELASENPQISNGVLTNKLMLMLCIFKMNGINTPSVKNVLSKYQLEYIPEAHNYLCYENEIIDCTTKSSSPENFIYDMITEIEILPHQISEFKIKYHKTFLKSWLAENSQINFSLAVLWNIREDCIQAMNDN